MLAARALAAHEDGQTDETALRVMAANPLTEATGQEQGSLLAVAIDGGSVVTTVSSAGRATRWDFRDGRLHPRSAIELPPEASLEAMSPGGRWLLLRTPILFEEALLVDTSGRRATRLLAAPEESAFAISEGERPLVARGNGSRLLLDEGSSALPAEGEISTLAFSPSGRLLAVGNRAGGSAVFVRSGKGWKILRPWREESAIGEIERIEVDDRGTTLANLESSVGPGVRWQSLGRGTDPHSVEGEGWLGGRSLTLEPLEHRLKLVDQRPRASDLAITVPFPIDGATVRPVALSPAGDRAVVAAPEGHFSVLDLRRVRPVRASVVAGSVELRGDRLSMLEASAAGSRLLAWNLGDLSPPERGPWLPGQPRVAVRAAGGSLLVHSGDDDAVFVRSGSDGSVIGRLRSRGEESWSSVAATPGGDLVAAADERSGAVTLWRLRRRPEGDVSGRVVLRTERPSDGRLEFPAPLAISPDGDRLVYGTRAGLFLRDLGNGREWPLPSPGEGETIRLRFDPASGRRLLASTSEAVIEFSGDRLRSQRRLVPLAAYDAVSLPTGATAAATGLGVQLYTRSGQAVEIDDGVTREGLGPGTLSASADNATLVPHTGGLPLVALRVDPPTPERLCALAGGRALTADGSCGPPPPMPKPHPPTGTPEDRSGDVTLSANGLGWLRLGEHLPAPAARLPAYFEGECAVRTLPGRGAAIITRTGRIESIALFQSPYAEDSARFRTDVEVATDRGLTPSAASSAAEAYGRADERSGSRGTWFLGRTSGGRSVLSVDDDYESEIPLTMSIEGARCEDLE
jgi:WD40 repeat protein